MDKATAPAKQVTGFLEEGLPDLSRNARNFLHKHPRDARMAVAVALEAAAAQCEARANDAFDEVVTALKPFVIRRPEDQETIGVSKAAARLQVSRPTIYDWVSKKTLLAWKSTKRGLNIPAAQIVAPGKVVPGLAQVLEIIDDPVLAWAFLSQEWPFAEETTTPLEKLATGQVEEVLAAAPGFGTTYT